MHTRKSPYVRSAIWELYMRATHPDLYPDLPNSPYIRKKIKEVVKVVKDEGHTKNPKFSLWECFINSDKDNLLCVAVAVYLDIERYKEFKNILDSEDEDHEEEEIKTPTCKVIPFKKGVSTDKEAYKEQFLKDLNVENIRGGFYLFVTQFDRDGTFDMIQNTYGVDYVEALSIVELMRAILLDKIKITQTF